jgi:hypothetical protein
LWALRLADNALRNGTFSNCSAATVSEVISSLRRRLDPGLETNVRSAEIDDYVRVAANPGEAVLLNRVLLAGLRLAGRIGTDNQLCAHVFRLAQILEASVPTMHLREADVDDSWRIIDQRSTAYGSALSLIEMLVNGLGILDSGSA